MSNAEEALAFQLRAVGLTGWVREHRFAHPRRWRFDFAFPSVAVAAEVEGGTWVAGRHGRGAGFEADAEKYNEAAIRGWCVIRVTPDMVADGRAVGVIQRAVRSRVVESIAREFAGRGDE
jgi:very-short-patch-repair endonuclease